MHFSYYFKWKTIDFRTPTKFATGMHWEEKYWSLRPRQVGSMPLKDLWGIMYVERTSAADFLKKDGYEQRHSRQYSYKTICWASGERFSRKFTITYVLYSLWPKQYIYTSMQRQTVTAQRKVSHISQEQTLSWAGHKCVKTPTQSSGNEQEVWYQMSFHSYVRRNLQRNIAICLLQPGWKGMWPCCWNGVPVPRTSCTMISFQNILFLLFSSKA